jgi:hypothetical protein
MNAIDEARMDAKYADANSSAGAKTRMAGVGAKQLSDLGDTKNKLAGAVERNVANRSAAAQKAAKTRKKSGK